MGGSLIEGDVWLAAGTRGQIAGDRGFYVNCLHNADVVDLADARLRLRLDPFYSGYDLTDHEAEAVGFGDAADVIYR